MTRHAPTAGPAADPPRRIGKLVVFFTRGMSLDGWSRAGILEREMALYRGLSADVDRLALVTYGGPADLAWASRLPGVEILPNLWGLAPNLYGVVAPWLHRRSLREASVFRANQINGAWCALVAQWLFRKSLVVRCGYPWADFVERLSTSPGRRLAARSVERLVLRCADRVIVTTTADASTIVRRYGLDERRVSVIPNYVDTCSFTPAPDVTPDRGRIIFVGRLEAQKNLESLIEALRGRPDLSLTVVGDGPLRPRLEALARAVGERVEFLGQLPHHDLPALLHRSEVFVLPSHYEGHPKALVEAMACGVPVVGGRVPGIDNLLVHRETGFLCGTSPAEIRAAVVELLDDAPLRARLSECGARFVQEHCSLEVTIERERAVLASLV